MLWSLDDILALSLVPKMRSVDLRRFVEEYASLSALLHAQPPELKKAKIFESHTAQDSLFGYSVEQGNTTLPSKTRSAASVYDELLLTAEVQKQLCATEDVRIVSYWDEAYPPLLKQIFYPPTLLYVRGTMPSSEVTTVGMVGTRHCTDYGRMAAEHYATAFAEAGVTVVSGLATGVDTFSHRASLKAGGSTIAVIASGIDKISPQSAAHLAEEMSGKKGAVVSEYPCGVAAQRAYFPRRNRIITGLSRAIVVVESGERGGSLITARFAMDENRELFAIPGRIYSERSRGTNILIQRSEARLTLTPQDVLETLGVEYARQTSSEDATELDEGEKRVLAALSGDPIHIETLAERTGTSVQDLLFILLELEFKGMVRQLAGKQFMRLGT